MPGIGSFFVRRRAILLTHQITPRGNFVSTIEFRSECDSRATPNQCIVSIFSNQIRELAVLIHFQITNAEGARGGAPPYASTAGPRRGGAAARAFVLSSLIVLSIPFFAHLLVAAEEMSWRQLAQDRIERALRGAWRDLDADHAAHQSVTGPALGGASPAGVLKFGSARLTAADHAGVCRYESPGRPLETLVSISTTRPSWMQAAAGRAVGDEDSTPEKSAIVTGATPGVPERALVAVAVSSLADTPSAATAASRKSYKRGRRQNPRVPSPSFEIVGIDWVWANMGQ